MATVAQSSMGTIVKLPPPPPPPPTIAATGSGSASAAPTSHTAAARADDGTHATERTKYETIGAGVAERRAGTRDGRKRELLLEARNARVGWILDAGEGAGGAGPGGGAGDGDDRPVGGLRACGPDVLPCAPRIVGSMLRPSSAASRGDGALGRLLEGRNLPWESVSGGSSPGRGGGAGASASGADAERRPGLSLPPVPSPPHYAAFLDALCGPPAADLVMSVQKFCGTVREAAGVMASSAREGGAEDPGAAEGGGDAAATTTTRQRARTTDHEESLAKAIRGFIKTTLRQMEDHEAFHGYLHPKKGSDDRPVDQPIAIDASATSKSDQEPTPKKDDAARDQLLASLEKFVYKKCRGDIDTVLLAGKEGSSSSSTKTMKESQLALHDKMLSLQFVTPDHLEISGLKSSSPSTPSAGDHDNDVDLSYTIRQLQSIGRPLCQSSPRQLLRAILLAHRGVSAALGDARGDGDPAGADDVLPTLILAVLRAHPPGLPSALRLVEHFAPAPLLRGEAGYAYTNLRGALQFIWELDVEGHSAEVALGGVGEGGVLSIGPEEFRKGLEGCRRKMEEAAARGGGEGASGGRADGGSRGLATRLSGGDSNDDGDADGGETPSEIRITAREVREARLRGATVDLDWALRRRAASARRDGGAGDPLARGPGGGAAADAAPRGRRRGARQEEPPPPRSYAFLAARPENVGVRDLPRLLKEYRMLVHATETLLDERAARGEGERKRRWKSERERLERDFAEVMGDEEGDRGKHQWALK